MIEFSRSVQTRRQATRVSRSVSSMCELKVCEKFCDKICPGNSRAFPRFFWEVTHMEGFVAKP